MINQLLHRDPVPVDREKHRHLKLNLPVTDWSVASRLNAIFVAAAEFGDACREYPIVFVRAGVGDDGKPQIAPIVVLGLKQEDNLFVEGGAWRTPYIPAVLRSYPFGIAQLNMDRFAICVDAAWPGLSEAEGQPLFLDDGQPSALFEGTQKQLEKMDSEVHRTRAACQRLLELDVLRDMRFDATMPDGRKHMVDGFMTIDDSRMLTLPDATIVELHRQGILGLVHAHWVSMGNMRRLLDWHIERHGAVVAPAG